MRKPSLLVGLCPLGGCLIGCVYVAVTPAGEKVKIIIDPAAPDPPQPGCQLIEETHKVPMGGWSTSPTDERSRAVMKNHAAEIGADTVRAQAFPSRGWYLKYYRCAGAAEKLSPAPTPTPSN